MKICLIKLDSSSNPEKNIYRLISLFLDILINQTGHLRDFSNYFSLGEGKLFVYSKIHFRRCFWNIKTTRTCRLCVMK